MQETGRIEIRLLVESDIPVAMQLKELARWNQTESDWRRLLRLEPNGCFCATLQGRVVGTTTTTTYGHHLAWIGMVLVDPAYRRRGIATKLMHAALDYLFEAGVATVKLDATPDGRPVYETLGFKIESLIERWEGVAGTHAVGCSPLDTAARREALTLDRRAFGAERSKLIEMLIADSYVAPLIATAADGPLTGYALARNGSAAVYVGPLLATGTEAATTLLDGLLGQVSGQRVYFDMNTGFEGGRKILTERGLVKQRDLIRMSYGKESTAGSSPSIFAIAGPEIG
ncbi:MAG: GNAT family N-acetyltransferase [Acidobacteriota bacterium]|nr:GNAT family N-acetyltransferase [Acidobacteriota bacterium]